jgi:membrane protease subunit HflK
MSAAAPTPGTSRFRLPPSFRPRAAHVLVLLLLAVGVHYYVTGVWTVDQTEQGVVLRFGRAVRVLPAGFHMTLPWPIETVERIVTTEVRTMPVGFKLTEDLQGIEPSEEEVQWLTGDTNIVDLRLVVQYVVRDPIHYLYRVADLPDGRSKNLVLRIITETLLTQLVARTRIDDVLSVGKAKLQNDARSAIQEMSDRLELGIAVLNVNIVEANPPAIVIPSFNDVSIAKQESGQEIDEADGYRKDLIPREKARANDILQEALTYEAEVVNRAQGAARSFLALSEKVKLSPEVSRKRLWLDAISEVLARCETIVYPSVPDRKFLLTTVE